MRISDPARPKPAPRPRPLPLPALALAPAILLLAGCQAGMSPVTAWRVSRDQQLVGEVSREEFRDAKLNSKTEIAPGTPGRGLVSKWLARSDAAVRGLGNRFAVRGVPDAGRPPVRETPDPEADAKLADAVALADAGDLTAAEKALRALAKSKRGRSQGEKAQYLLAEIRFRRGNHVAAREDFDQLLKDYPGTRFLERALERQFALGEYWLARAAPEIRETAPQQLRESPVRKFDDQIMRASMGSERAAAAERERLAKIEQLRIPLDQSRWTDRLRGDVPLVDPGGAGVQVLEKVRHHDPLGPLAATAAAKIADYLYFKGDYRSAAEYYERLVADHPKSPEASRARLAAVDARLRAYVGPDYDSVDLERAAEIARQTQAIFPEQIEINQALNETLARVQSMQAERAFRRGEYYRSIGKVASAEYMFGMIPARWPSSEFVEPAREQLQLLAKLPRDQRESLPSRTMVRPGANESLTGERQSSGGMNNMMLGF